MIEEILKEAMSLGASDVHINVGMRPAFRINLVMQASESPVATPEGVQRIVRSVMTERRYEQLQAQRDVDVSYDVLGVGRFRINAHYQRDNIALSIRTLPEKVRPLEALFLPDIVSRLTALPRGLVLVTGPAGSGKSTTLAAMVDAINHRDRGHIITLEDPIEHAYLNDKCVIEQREVGGDVPDLAGGLRHALRQDADAIMVTELRDVPTTDAAITAAETGRLVLSTMHTLGAGPTIDRLIEMHPNDQQNCFRLMLADNLQAVVSQTLLRRCDTAGMVPAVEVMVCTPAVRNCIRENRIHEIPAQIEAGSGQGMQSLDHSIQQLLANGFISRQDAQAHISSPDKLDRIAA